MAACCSVRGLLGRGHRVPLGLAGIGVALFSVPAVFSQNRTETVSPVVYQELEPRQIPALEIEAILATDDLISAAQRLKLHSENQSSVEALRESPLSPAPVVDENPVDFVIHLPNDQEFSPNSGIEPALDASFRSRVGFQERGEGLPADNLIAILQYQVPFHEAELLLLLEAGVRIYDRVGTRAFIVRLPRSKIRFLETLPFVRWLGVYRSEYKYHLDILPEPGRRILLASLDGDREGHRRDLESMGVAVDRFDDFTGSYVVDPGGAQISEMADLWWVQSVSPFPDQVLEGAVTVFFEPNDSRQLISATYSGFSGVDVNVGIRDGPGVYKNHDELSGIFLAGSETYSTDDAGQYHGSHVAGIIAGRNESIEGYWGPSDIEGVSPSANVLFRSLGGSDYPLDFDAFRTASIQISNHSYSFLTEPYAYASDTTKYYDQACDDDDMVLVKSAGNSGLPYKITNPGTAKNVLTVGAIDFNRDIGELFNASSQGPTADDKRLKPEIVAPGGAANETDEGPYGVVSTSASSKLDGFSDCWSGTTDYWAGCEWETDESYTRMGGTSMAAPHVTGSLALIKQWSSSTSSEFLKALLINTTIPLKGNSSDALAGYANNQFGYGLVNAYSPTSYYVGEYSRLLQGTGSVSETDLSDDFTATVPEGAKKFIVTLAYNDEEGETTNDKALIDNLELILISPQGVLYRASEHLPADVETESPLEKMVIVNPVSGTWTVRIGFDSPRGLGDVSIFSQQQYAVVADAILKTPELSLSEVQYNTDYRTWTDVTSNLVLFPGQRFSLKGKVTNTGGFIAAGVNLRVTGAAFGGEVGKRRYLGNLMYQGANASGYISLEAPTSVGTYYIYLEADGINKEFDTASYPRKQQITVVVKEAQPGIIYRRLCLAGQTCGQNISEIWEGQSFTVEVQAKNDGATADGDITLSFPEFDSINDSVLLELGSGDSLGFLSRPAGGSLKIWTNTCQQMTAQYLMVAYSDTSWLDGEVNALRVRVTPKTSGVFPVYVRSAMRVPPSSTDCDDVANFPGNSLYFDQQGWPVYRHLITVKPVLQSLTVSGPSTVDEGAVGSFTATASFSDGSTSTVTGSSTWSETCPGTISTIGVLSAGTVTADTSCTVSASYSYGGVTKSGSKTTTVINVSKILTGITVSGPSTVNEGATGSFIATATFDDLTTSNVTSSANWTETCPGTINSSGVLTAGTVTADTNCTVSASYTYGGVTKSGAKTTKVVNVYKLLTDVTVTGPSTVNEGETGSFVATAGFDDSTTSTVTTSASWSETCPGTINSSGVLTAGTVTSDISCTVSSSYSHGGVTKSGLKTTKILNTTKILTSLAVAGPSTINEGSTGSFTATATFDDQSTSSVTTSASWTETCVGTINSSGVLTAGTVTYDTSCIVSAEYTYDGVTKTGSLMTKILNVSKILTGLTVSGPSTVSEGATGNFVATATFDDQSTSTVTTSANWAETCPGTINSSGVFTAGTVTADTSCTVSASYSYGGVTKSGSKATQILNATKVLTSLTVAGPSTINEGATGGFTATATFDDQSTSNVTTSANWTETCPGTINSSGVFTAGTVTTDTSCTVSASYSYGGVTKSGSKVIQILDTTNILTSLAVTGPSTVDEGATGSFTATATFDDQSTSTVTTSATWTETCPGTINSSGVLTAGTVSTDTSCMVTAQYSLGGVTKSSSKPVTIKNQAANLAPDGEITAPSTDLLKLKPNVSYTFRGTASDPDGAIASCTWDWGGALSYHSVVPSSTPAVSKSFPDYGDFNVEFTATDNEGAQDPTPDSFLLRIADLSDHAFFVRQVYLDFLNREPDTGGFDYWLGELNQGNRTRAEVCYEYFKSPEFQGNGAYIGRLYMGIMFRRAEYAGFNYWLGELRSGNRTKLEILYQFINSPEFQEKFGGSLSNSEFVRRLFLNILEREPDASGLAFWTAKLDSGEMTREEVAWNFVESPEFIYKTENSLFIQLEYFGLLRREAEDAGHDYWLNEFNNGRSKLDLINLFLGSEEYRLRFED